MIFEKLIKIVEEAGEIVKEGFKSVKEVKYKGEIDLVTKYDVEVENFLKPRIQALYPEYTIVAEESTDVVTRPDKGIYIDPIDGTTNFVHGFPFVAVSVGIYDGITPVCGIVYNPVMEEMFTAEKGKGAFLNGEPISVKKSEKINQALIATGFPYSAVYSCSDKMMNILNNVLHTTRGIRRAGSAALDLCYTARGTFDAYYEFNLKPWDIAGGMVIVSEAGGVVSNSHGKNHNLLDDCIIAGSPKAHSEIFEIVKRASEIIVS